MCVRGCVRAPTRVCVYEREREREVDCMTEKLSYFAQILKVAVPQGTAVAGASIVTLHFGKTKTIKTYINSLL